MMTDIEKIAMGISNFKSEMKKLGIHVGVDGICCTCGTAWPCPNVSKEIPINILINDTKEP